MTYRPLLLLAALAITSCSDDDDPPGGARPGPAPTEITLSSASAYANLPGKLVGELNATGQDAGDTVTYTVGGDKAAYFAVAGATLSTSGTAIPNEEAPTLVLNVTATTNTGATFSKDFAISIVRTTTVAEVSDSGAGSLRQLIADAPTNSAIVLSASAPIVVTSPLVVADKALTIIGANANAAINGSGTSDIIDITETGALVLVDLSLGNAMQNAIQNQGTLTIDGVTIHDSGADSRGGAIGNGGTAYLNFCVIRNNRAFNGGGIANSGTMFINGCVITDNEAGNSAGGLVNNGTLEVVNTIFANNHADEPDRVGGAIGVFSSEGGRTVTMRLAFVTIVGNTTASSTGGGPGIYLGDETTTEIRASVIADNTSGATDVGDILAIDPASLTSRGYLVIGKGEGTALTTAGTDVVGSVAAPISAGLDVLGNYGGVNQSMPPRDGSPVLEKVPASACTDFDNAPLTFDVRGQTRPTGAACEIGATERS